MLKLQGKKSFYFVFFLLNVFLSSFFMYVWDDWNSISRILPVLSLIEEGNLEIDKYHDRTGDKSFVNGHYYSDKAPLPSLLIAPVYGGLKMMGFIYADPGAYNEKQVYYLGSLLSSSVPFALIILLSFLYSEKKTGNLSLLFVAMFTFYGSFLFVYTGTFYGHLIAGLFLLLSYILLKFHGKYFLSGLFLGFGFLSEYPVGLALPVWAIVLFIKSKNFKQPFLLGMGFLPALVFILIYNYALSGSAITMLYHFVVNEHYSALNNTLGFSLPKLSVLWDLLFSQFRGIFFYFPVLAIAAYQILRNNEPGSASFFKSYLFPLVVFYLLLISAHAVWWGGWVFGPRHLIPVAVLLGFESVRVLSRSNIQLWVFAPIAIFGLFICWMAKSTVVFDIISDIQYPLTDMVIPEFLKGHFNPNNLFTHLFNISPSNASIAWLVIFVVLIFVLNMWYRKIFSSTK